MHGRRHAGWPERAFVLLTTNQEHRPGALSGASLLACRLTPIPPQVRARSLSSEEDWQGCGRGDPDRRQVGGG